MARTTTARISRLVLQTAILLLLSGVASPASAGMGAFADCVRRSGAVLYGAPWCSVCRTQRNLFQGYGNRLRYVECSSQNNHDVFESCKKRGIDGFPTWDFGNGKRVVGGLSLTDVARMSGCTLPREAKGK